MPRLLENINFPKVISVLAATFGIALGACGLTAIASMKFPGMASLGMLELAVIILSAAGLVLMAFLWVVASLLGQRQPRDPEIQTLFDDPPNRGPERDDKE